MVTCPARTSITIHVEKIKNLLCTDFMLSDVGRETYKAHLTLLDKNFFSY